MSPMGYTTVARHIAGDDYSIGTLPLGVSEDILLRLSKNLGPAVGEFLEGLGGGTPGGGLPAKAIAGAIRDVCLRLEATDIKAVRLAFGKVCSVKGVPLDANFQEIHFAGRLGAMLQWMIACVEHNYSDFFEYAAAAAKSANSSAAPEASHPPSA